jgi:PAS domain S-box-containing protein
MPPEPSPASKKTAAPDRREGDAPSENALAGGRDDRVADLERQILDLQFQLESLRSVPAASSVNLADAEVATKRRAAASSIQRLYENVQHYGVMMLDLEGRIAHSNPEALRIYGVSDESRLVGQRLATWYLPNDAVAGLPQRHLEAAARLGQWEEEAKRARADGESFWALSMIRALHDEHGQLGGFAYVIRDISQRKRDEERSRLLIDLALNAMVLVDERGEILQVNPQTEKTFGYTTEELLGQSIELLVPERFRGNHPKSRNQFFDNPAVRAMGAGRDLYGRRKDGSEFPVEIGLNPVLTDDGLLVVGSVVDITQRKRAEERFRLAVESAPSAMVMSNNAGQIVLVNLQTERMFGYPREALLGQQIEMLVPERFRAEHPGYRHAFFRRPAARPMGAGRDLHGRRRDGSEFPVEIGLTPIETEDGVFVLSAIVDITERKQAEERSRRQLAEMAHAGRLITVGEMFSGLAHEINQPLAAAANYARACVRFAKSEQGVSQEQLLEWMEKTAAQATRAAEIVKRAGTFVRRERVAHAKLDVNRVIEHVLSLPVVDALPGDRGARVTPELEFTEPMPLVLADRVQIEQVLLNLVRNAIESMADAPPPQRRLVLKTAVESGNVVVSVTDAGHGISEEQMARLFEPFYTTKDDGMGLGLSISRSIIEAHSGRLFVEANADRGSTFRFSLPLLHDEVRP